jgi:molybdopterin-binding protein
VSKIKVKKIVDGTVENSFKVPVFALNILAQLLPESAISELVGRGIDIQAILRAQKLGTPYSSSVEVIENGVQKTIAISVE